MNMSKDILEKEYKFPYGKSGVDKIYLGYSIDNRFARCTGTSIYSFIKNHPNRNFSIEIITSSLSNDSIERFELLAKERKVDINIYIINIHFLEKLNLDVSIKWPIATYFRFLYPFVLKDIKKIFYIDGDIMCINPCDELFDMDLSNVPIAACKDESPFTIPRCKELGLKQGSYFNAGMLVINSEKWLELDVWNKFLGIIHNRKQVFKSHDQDILNILFVDNILYLDDKFNYQSWIKYLTQDEIDNNQVVLLHFGGHPKPWQATWCFNRKYNNVIANIYGDLEKNTPWKDVPLDLPNDYKDRRLYAKLLFRKGKVLKGCKEFILYTREKMSYKMKK